MLNDRMKTIAEQQTQKLVLKGKTIKYNNRIIGGQFNDSSLFEYWGIFNSDTSVGALTFNNGIAKITYTGLADADYRQALQYPMSWHIGQKFFCSFKIRMSKSSRAICELNGDRLFVSEVLSPNEWHTCSFVATIENQYSGNNLFYPSEWSVFGNGETMEITDVMLVLLPVLDIDYIANINEFYATDLGKAIKNGYYPPYTTTNKLVSLTSPFTFKREIEYNNQVQNGNFVDTTSWLVNNVAYGEISASNNELTYRVIQQTSGSSSFLQLNVNMVKYHKYIAFATLKASVNTTKTQIAFYKNGLLDIKNISLVANQETKIESIFTYTLESGNSDFYFYYDVDNSHPANSNMQAKNVMLIDLTQLGLDSISSVADFYKTELGKLIKEKMYLPYSKDNDYIFGRQLYDKTNQSMTGYNEIVSNYIYVGNINSITILLKDDLNAPLGLYLNEYDIDQNIIIRGSDSNQNHIYSAKEWTINLQQNTKYVVLRVYRASSQTDVEKTKTWNNLLVQSSSYTNKSYVAYLKPLTYIHTKRVDLGTLSWSKLNDNKFYSYSLENVIKKPSSASVLPNVRTGKYKTRTLTEVWDNLQDKSICVSHYDAFVGIRDTDYDNATDFKNSLSGVILEYETAEQLELNGINNDRVVDLGRLYWLKGNINYSGNGQIFYCDAQGSLGFKNAPKFNAPTFNCIQESLRPTYWEELEPNEMIIASNYVVICVDTTYQDTTSLLNRINGIMLTYETDRESLCDTFTNTNGKVNRKYFKLKINDISFNYSSGNFRFTISTAKAWNVTSEPSPYIFLDGYETKSANDLLTTSDKCIGQSGQVVIIRDTRYTSVAQFKSAVGELQVMYLHYRPSGTPQTERSVLVDHRYNKVVDTNGIEIDTD